MQLSHTGTRIEVVFSITLLAVFDPSELMGALPYLKPEFSDWWYLSCTLWALPFFALVSGREGSMIFLVVAVSSSFIAFQR